MRGTAEDLQLGLLDQGAMRYPEQRQVTTASIGLDRTELKSAPGSQRLLANAEDTTLQIHVTPAQPENPAAAQSINEQ